VPPAFAFNRTMLERPDMRDAIEAAAGDAFGRALRLEVAIGGAAAGAQAQAESATLRKRALKDKVLEDPTVKRVLEAFEGSVVDVEDTNV
jgi:hypothetical protein